MRFACSASNRQSWEFIALTEDDNIEMLRQEVVSLMKLSKIGLKVSKLIKPFLPKDLKEMVSDPGSKIGLKEFFHELNKGKDPVFYNAPAIIITYAPKYGSMAGPDAGIAFTYGMLVAQSRGLGTCWIGYAQEALRRFKKKSKWLNIPKGMNVNGVMTLGYPSVKYHRAPPREPLKIIWK